jgi:hypothetical protein
MSEFNKEQALEFSEKFVTMVMAMDRKTAFVILPISLAVLWSNGTNLTTITEAVDGWRAFSAIVEKEIRQNFGAIRYAGPDQTND